MTGRSPATLLVLSLLVGSPIGALPAQGVETKYVRDSEAYATLTRQVYRAALNAVRTHVADAQVDGPWGVVLDIDETTLDNSTYQLELGAYRREFDEESWNAWVRRQEAGAVPGVVEFVSGVRDLGGRVVWLSNRGGVVRSATQRNLELVGLWRQDDRLCLRDDPDYSKADRRGELAAGEGKCAWAGEPIEVFAFLGDQLGDFPHDGEPFDRAGDDDAFGNIFFLLPNPMYGPWVGTVTRRR